MTSQHVTRYDRRAHKAPNTKTLLDKIADQPDSLEHGRNKLRSNQATPLGVGARTKVPTQTQERQTTALISPLLFALSRVGYTYNSAVYCDLSCLTQCTVSNSPQSSSSISCLWKSVILTI